MTEENHAAEGLQLLDDETFRKAIDHAIERHKATIQARLGVKPPEDREAELAEKEQSLAMKLAGLSKNQLQELMKI